MQPLIIKLLKKHTKFKEIILEIPPSPNLGDYAFPCFQLAQKLKRSPTQLASELASKLKPPKGIEKITAQGPYLNFYLNRNYQAQKILKKILQEKDKYGSQKSSKTLVLESPGPNTNKPLHIGHLRNIVLGLSFKHLQEKIGLKVFPVDIINDRGIHIAKSALAYQKFGNNKKPNKKPDHFVGDFYVLFSKKTTPQLESEAQALLKKYEQGDKKTLALFKKMNLWAFKGIQETYKRLGLEIKKTYFESKYYKKGKTLIFKNLKKGFFKQDPQGNIFVDLKKYNLGKKILLRADGTSLYITQDLYVALQRYKDFKMDSMLYIVGSEQIYHFQVLFKILDLLNCKFVKNYSHLPYGMVYLPEGRLKSREGNILDADTLLDEMHTLAKKEIQKRHKLNPQELEKRSEILAQSALKFFLLKYDPLKDFTFYPEKSLSFEGDTGPYLQYTHARACSILRKAKTFKPAFNLTKKIEHKILTHLSSFPQIVEEAATKYKPHLLTQYALELAHLFNEFYHKYPVLKASKSSRNSRLTLVKALKQILQLNLELLAITPLEKM